MEDSFLTFRRMMRYLVQLLSILINPVLPGDVKNISGLQLACYCCCILFVLSLKAAGKQTL